MSKYTVAVLVGSLRKESINRKLARALEKLSADRLQFDYVEIGNLPLYNQDFDSEYPPACVAFKARVKAADALLIITPEYNRSMPGVLKNALDIGSRPHGQSVFSGKPCAVGGASEGGIASALAQRDLRAVLTFLDVRLMAQPELYLRFSQGLIDAEGNVDNQKTEQFLQGFVERYVQWIDEQNK